MRRLFIVTLCSCFVLYACSTSRNSTHKESAPASTELSCPQSSGSYLLPRTHKLESIYLSFAFDDLIPTAIRSVREQNLDVEINIIIGQQDWEVAWDVLSPYKSDSGVNFLVAPTSESFWIQDYLEVGTNLETGKNFLVELPYSNRDAEPMPVSIALWRKLQLQRIPTDLVAVEDHSNGDYGGNIEALPGGNILIGDNMAKNLRKYLRTLFPSQSLIDVPVAWLETGHVDELFSIVPSHSNDCGFAILHASPQLGLKMLEKYPDQGALTVEDPPKERPWLYPFAKCGMAQTIEGCKTLVKANHDYDLKIREGVRKLKAALQTVCKEPQFIPLPQIFHPIRRMRKYGGQLDAARSLNPNTVNNLLIGKDLIYAQQNNILFDNYIETKIKSLGLRPLPIDTRQLHSYSGGIHCATLATQSCRVDANQTKNANAK